MIRMLILPPTIIIAFLVFPAVEVFSQVQIGFLAGGNISRQNLSNAESGSVRVYDSRSEEAKSQFLEGFHGGAMLSFDLKPSVKFRPSILYVTKGQIERIDLQSSADIKYKDRINYLEMPVVFSFYLGKQRNQSQGLFLNTGFYIARGVGGKSSYTDNDSRDTETGEVIFKNEINRKTDFGDYDLIVKKNDLGLKLGLGVQAKSLIFEINHSLGILNVHPQILQPRENSLDDISNERKKRNISWSIGMIYLFNVRADKGNQ